MLTNGLDAKDGTVAKSEHPTMTISGAQDIFRKYDDGFFKDNENLVKLLRASQSNSPLSNGSYLHALVYTDQMFRFTKSSFRMLTGSCGDGFLSALGGSFKKMLERLESFEGKAKIIIVGEGSIFLNELKQKFPETLQVVEATAKPGTEVSHFIVCDNDMVRDESPHPPLSLDKDANLIRANVYFHNRAVAEIFSLRFEQAWEFLAKKEPVAVGA